MVVIDPEETVLENTPKPPQPAPSTSKTTTDSTSSETTTTTTKAAAVKGSDSDGFETASESGVSDNEEEQVENVSKEISSKNTTEDQPKQDTQNDDELIQVFTLSHFTQLIRRQNRCYFLGFSIYYLFNLVLKTERYRGSK
jgi:hypothetical protein